MGPFWRRRPNGSESGETPVGQMHLDHKCYGTWSQNPNDIFPDQGNEPIARPRGIGFVAGKFPSQSALPVHGPLGEDKGSGGHCHGNV
jgi:hypothetical protein